jgi:hypothetical protein
VLRLKNVGKRSSIRHTTTLRSAVLSQPSNRTQIQDRFAPNRVEASLLAPLQESHLLTFEGEQLLFKQLNFLRFRTTAIQATLQPKRPAMKKVREV